MLGVDLYNKYRPNSEFYAKNLGQLVRHNLCYKLKSHQIYITINRAKVSGKFLCILKMHFNFMFSCFE